MAMNECSPEKINEKSHDYHEILELAEIGQTEEALVRIQEYLASAPYDAEALNDTGAILFSLGHTDEAIKHFSKARDLFPDSAEIIWNTVEAYLATNNPRLAMEYFDTMKQLGILSADILNRTANVLLENENFPDAAKVLRQSLEMSPEQEILHPMIEVIDSKIQKMTD